MKGEVNNWSSSDCFLCRRYCWERNLKLKCRRMCDCIFSCKELFMMKMGHNNWKDREHSQAVDQWWFEICKAIDLITTQQWQNPSWNIRIGNKTVAMNWTTTLNYWMYVVNCAVAPKKVNSTIGKSNDTLIAIVQLRFEANKNLIAVILSLMSIFAVGRQCDNHKWDNVRRQNTF